MPGIGIRRIGRQNTRDVQHAQMRVTALGRRAEDASVMDKTTSSGRSCPEQALGTVCRSAWRHKRNRHSLRLVQLL